MSVDRGRPAPRRASNPRFWAKLTVPIGTLVQLTGLVIGIGLIALAGTFRDWTALAPIMMVLGFVLIYLCCHAVAHFFVGRMVGLRFAYIGVRGTDHPENYPPGLRQLMSVVPMFTTVSTKESRQRASAWRLACYYAAGETSTTVCSIAAAGAALLLRIPGSQFLFVTAVVWVVISTVVTAPISKGDYAKARTALRGSV